MEKDVTLPIMSNEEIVNLQQWLWEVSDNKGTKFAYAVKRNRDKVDSYVKELKEKYLSESAEFKVFNEKRNEVAKSFAEKDEDGNPKTRNGNYVIADRKAFDKEVKEFKKKYKDVIEKREKQITEFDAVMKEMSTLLLYAISKDELPDDLTANQLDGIYSLIV